jgi:hypothetical protein
MFWDIALAIGSGLSQLGRAPTIVMLSATKHPYGYRLARLKGFLAVLGMTK